MLLCLKHEIRAMMADGSGRIVNIASAAGYIGFATAGIYVASKHTVMASHAPRRESSGTAFALTPSSPDR